MITDYKLLTMEFQWNGKTVHLIGKSQVNDEMLSGKQFMKLSKSQNIVSLFHLKAMIPDSIGQEMPECVKPLLQQFVVLFQDPTTLPPERDTDHQIHLKPDTEPINVRPYRYPYFQKSEMEKLVHEMLQQGIIGLAEVHFLHLFCW